MSQIAITREISPRINDCELLYHARQPIDVAKAVAQHEAYRECLAQLGLHVVSLPAEPDLPDSVFVEDPAVVVDEVAIIARLGAASRRPEARSLAKALARYRPLQFLEEPATLDGGDILRVGRTLFVGLSRRTNRAGFEQLRDMLRPYDYTVRSIEVRGCLHLKSACSALRQDFVLVNRSWIDPEPLREFELLEVPSDEPAAANVLVIGDTVIMLESFPKTRHFLEDNGYSVRALDVFELQKAEAGVTCCSIILKHLA